MVKLQTLQLNIRKQKEVHLSLLNDLQLKEYSILFITELHLWPTEDGELVVTLIQHTNWAKVLPTEKSNSR